MTAQTPIPAPQPSPVSVSTSVSSAAPKALTTTQSPSQAIQPPLQSPPPAVPSPLETQRVTLLLEINRVLLLEVMDLQSTGKINIPGQPQPSPPSQSPSDTAPKPDNTTSTTPDGAAAVPKPQPQTAQQAAAQLKAVNKNYLEYMRRLQANLAYLASIADRAHKPWNAIPQFPAILEPPPPTSTTMTTVGEGEEAGEKAEKKSIRELYGRLKELWPEYKTKNSGTTAG